MQQVQVDVLRLQLLQAARHCCGCFVAPMVPWVQLADEEHLLTLGTGGVAGCCQGLSYRLLLVPVR